VRQQEVSEFVWTHSTQANDKCMRTYSNNRRWHWNMHPKETKCE